MISLRGRSRQTRNFKLVREIRQEAELRFRTKEQELQAKLSEIREKMNKLMTTTGGQSQSKGNLNSVQKKAMDTFRGEMSEIRKELRSVQHALRQDIDRLDSWLKFLNIAGIPLLIGLGALISFVFGRVSRRQQA